MNTARAEPPVRQQSRLGSRARDGGGGPRAGGMATTVQVMQKKKLRGGGGGGGREGRRGMHEAVGRLREQG